MEAEPARRARLVRQYELLLVARHRLALHKAIDSLHAVAQTLQQAELRLLRELATVSLAEEETATQRRARFHDAVELVLSQLRQLAMKMPVFLGDSDLYAFARLLREFTEQSGMEQLLQLELNKRERQFVASVETELVGELRQELETLNHAIVCVLPVAKTLRKKRAHLIQLVNASLAVVERARTARTAELEEKKAQLMKMFKHTVHDPALRECKQLKHAIATIERAMMAMLLPHIEVCRPITAANAKVTPATELFDELERAEIDSFVSTARQLHDSTAAFSSLLHDADTFVRQIKLFEKAASTDAFVVYSSALKLEFRESLDDELFLAYAADWREKQEQRQDILTSNQYEEASQRVANLKEDIMRIQIALQNSRQEATLDEPSKMKLISQIAEVFHELGGDTTQIIQVIN